jgi:hypothetical protein
MVVTKEGVKRYAAACDAWGLWGTSNVLRSFAAERDALKAENEVMEAALRRINSSITPQKEIALQAENARLREAIEMAIDCIEDVDVIGARQTLTVALGEKE